MLELATTVAMTGQPIGQIIHDLAQAPTWAPYRRWQTILTAWPEVLAHLQLSQYAPEVLAQQIYPQSCRGNYLQVATASASLADHCNWQRRSLLNILNRHLLDEPLTDLRFSSSRWQAQQATPTVESIDSTVIDRDLCPQCAACTPRWELERWSVCRFCISQQWR
jgi:predicted nucleic acid-binding Zn ribbon protein